MPCTAIFAGCGKIFTEVTYTLKYVDYNDDVLSTQTVNIGEEITEPTDPTRVGYTFVGWDISVSTNSEASTITATAKAKYEINTYTVKFVYTNENSEEVVLSSQEINYGEDATAPSTTREGYTFVSWSTTNITNITADLTITATYTEVPAQTYTVTFVDSDGITVIQVDGQDSQTVVEGEDAVAPTNPTKEGFVFVGWDKTFNNITSTLTVKANYIEVEEGTTYVLKFVDYNGTTVIPVNEQDTQIITTTSTISQPADPTRVGYTFVGWDISSVANTENNTVTITATAKYEINTSIVAFVYLNNDGETFFVSYQEVNYGEGAVPPTAPTRYEYIFVGWNTDSDATTADATGYASITSDLMIYAIYKLGFTATIYLRDGSEIAEGSVLENWEYNESLGCYEASGFYVSTDLPVLEKNGYTFIGWNTSSEETTPNAEYVDNLYFRENCILYAIFREGTIPASCTVTIDLDSGTTDILYYWTDLGNSQYSKELTRSSFVYLPTGVTKTGYNFLGWSNDGGTTYITEVKFGDLTQDTTYTAIYEVVYTLTLDLNGGNGDTLIFGGYTYDDPYYSKQIGPDSFALPKHTGIPSISKDGFTFLGWSNDGGLTYSIDVTIDPSTLEGNVTYTAIWELSA